MKWTNLLITLNVILLLLAMTYLHYYTITYIEKLIESKMIVCKPPAPKGSQHCNFEKATKYRVN